MYLRKENETETAVKRRLGVDRRVDALRASLGCEPSPSDAKNRLDLAAIYCWRGLYDPTLELLTPLLDPMFSKGVTFEARQMIADCHFRHDQYDTASRIYNENADAARMAGNEYWTIRARDGFAWVLIDVGHYSTGEFEEAGRIFQCSLPIHQRLKDWVSVAMGMYGLSRSIAGMGNYGDAIRHAKKSIEILEAHDGAHLLQLPLLQIANVYRDEGSFDRARPYFELARDAADDSQDPYVQVLVAYHYGLLLKRVHETDSALEMWKQVLPTIKKLDFPRLGSEICRDLALHAAEQGSFEEAYRLQIDSQSYGNRVGVISRVLQNQQLLLRTAIHQTGQLENQLTCLNAGIEASEDGIFVLSPPDPDSTFNEYIIRFANLAAAQMFGQKPVDIIHVPLATVWAAGAPPSLVNASLDVFETGDRRSIDPLELELTKGHRRWYSVKVARISDGVAWTVSDVTERETMRQEILAQRDRLEEANETLVAVNREKSHVLGIAAHDLRSPIGNIRSICDFLPTDDPKTAKLVSMIESSSDALLELISNLLDVERIESGELELDIGRLALEPILAQTIDQFSVSANEKDIQINLSAVDTSMEVLADENSLRRVLQNLLSNAVKFSPLGSTVEVRAMVLREKARVEIQDHGSGISESDRHALFGKFVRLSARPTAGESSSGLGLSIVKHLTNAMGGQVGCDSQSGAGATFWFEIPINEML